MNFAISKQKLISIVLIVLTIIYIIIGGALFLNITGMTPPETTISLNVIELNANEAIIDASIAIENPNPFTLITKDFDILLQTPDKQEISHVSFAGGDVPGQGNATFATTAEISLLKSNLDVIHATISTTLGANILGITKTLPLQITLITNMGTLIQDLDAPHIEIIADLTAVTQEGVTIETAIEITNPNSFDIYVHNMSLAIQTDAEENVGSLTLEDIEIQAQETQTIQGQGFLNIEALNAERLTVELDAEAGVTLAGYTESLEVHADMTLLMPDLQNLIPVDQMTDLVLWGDYRLTLRGILVNVTIEVVNPNDISIQSNDLTVSIYRVDGEDETFIVSKNIGSGIAPIGGKLTVAGDLTIPYRSLLRAEGHFGLPDWLLVSVSANMSVPGLDVILPVRIVEYQDLQYFK